MRSVQRAEIQLRAALPIEASALSALALRSKAHWGYDEAFLEMCRDELTIRPEECDGDHLFVAEAAAGPVGFYQLAGDPPTGQLLDLWVDPPMIGCGVGGALLADALRRADGLGFELLVIEADPNAEPFYLHAGATRAGSVPSESIPGRQLPLLELRVPSPS